MWATRRRQVSGAASPVALTTPALAMSRTTRSWLAKSSRRWPLSLARSMSSRKPLYASVRRVSRALAAGKVIGVSHGQGRTAAESGAEVGDRSGALWCNDI